MNHPTYEESINAMKSKYETLNNAIRKHSPDLIAKQKKYDNLISDKNSLDRLTKSTQGTIAGLTTSINQKRQQRTDPSNPYLELTTEIRTLQSDLEIKEDELTLLSSDIQNKNVEIDKLRQDIDLSKLKVFKALNKQIYINEESLSDHEKNLEEIEKTLEGLNTKIAKSEDSYQQTRKKRIEALKAGEDVKQLDKDISTLRNEKASLEDEQAHCEVNKSSIKGQISAIQDEINNIIESLELDINSISGLELCLEYNRIAGQYAQVQNKVRDYVNKSDNIAGLLVFKRNSGSVNRHYSSKVEYFEDLVLQPVSKIYLQGFEAKALYDSGQLIKENSFH